MLEITAAVHILKLPYTKNDPGEKNKLPVQETND